jgi:hypothetical protein
LLSVTINMSFGIFKEIERLVEYIPIETRAEGIGKLIENTNIDTQFYFKDLDGIAVRLGVLEMGKNTISLRDIIKLLNKFLKDAKIDEIVESPRRYRQLQSSGSGLPLKNLLFDFSLSALNGDYLDAKLYLTHSFYLLGLRRRFVLLLSIMINEPLSINDRDVRKLLTYLALMSEPNNVDVHFDMDNNGFSNRYSIYLQEIQKVSLPNIEDSPLINLSKIKN